MDTTTFDIIEDLEPETVEGFLEEEIQAEEDADKIAALLLDEGEPKEEIESTEPTKVDQTQVDENMLVKVKINGVEKEVPLSELKNGYQRQSDYTSKTQSLAQEKQEVDAARQKYEQYVQSIPMLFEVAQNNLQQAQQALYSPEMMELAQTDPGEYVAQKAKIESEIVKNSQALGQMEGQWKVYQEETQQYRQQVMNEVLQKANEILTKELPGWADGSVKPALAEYGRSIGFTDEDLSSVYDHRQLLVLNKARLYDELVKKSQASKKATGTVPPKTITPGTTTPTVANPNKAIQKTIKQAQATGDTRDVTDIIAQKLMGG